MLIVAKGERRAPPGPASSDAAGKPRMDRPFDHWLHKQLHEMYDSIAKEPLPDDLMKLIDHDAGIAAKSEPDTADRDKKN